MSGTTVAVVRAFNEAPALPSVLDDLAGVVDEILVVDDGSSDGSAAIAVRAGATVLSHAINLGGGAALRTGLEYIRTHSTHSHILTFDADGQHRSDDAVRMLALARESGVDVVLGTRNMREESIPVSRRLLLKAAVNFSRMSTGLDLSDTHNGLRVLNRRALESIQLTQPGMAYASELEASIRTHGLTWAECPVLIRYDDYCRRKGQRNINAVNIIFDLALSRLRRLA